MTETSPATVRYNNRRLKIAGNWMKTRPGSLIQLKSGSDSHLPLLVFPNSETFCHTSGSERWHLMPDYACSITKRSPWY